MHEIDSTYFNVYEQGRAFGIFLKSEFMKPHLPGRSPRYFRVGLLPDGRILINQNDVPHNPILSADMFTELTQIIQRLNIVRQERQGLFPCYWVIESESGRVCGSYLREVNARLHQTENPTLFSIVPASQPDPETVGFSAGYVYSAVVKTDTDYEG